jgi:hypothetical protein
MAVPQVATDLTDISLAESTTGWVGIGGTMTPLASTDFFRQGSGAVSSDAKGSLGRRGIAYDNVTGIDFTVANRYLYVWVNIVTNAIVNTTALDGVRIYVSSSTGADTNYAEYTVGGSDAAWVGNGFALFIIDVNGETPENSSGTLDKTSVKQFGLVVDMTATLGKADGFIIDAVRYGGETQYTSPEHTGASDLDFNDNGAGEDTIVRPSGSWITDGFETGDTIVVTGTTSNNGTFTTTATAVTATTLSLPTGTITDEQNTSGTVVAKFSAQDIVDEEGANGADTHHGAIYDDANGNKLCGGGILIGDEAGALNTWCDWGDEVNLFNQERVPAGANYVTVDSDTGTTFMRVGSEVGSGNDSKGVGGGLWKGVGTAVFDLNGNLAFDEWSMWGAKIQNANLTKLENTNIEWVSCTFSGCGSITHNSGAELREGFITDSSAVSGVGAIEFLASPTDPEFRDMTLINNIHAIEWAINGATTMDLRGIKFAGNTADYRYNHTTGLHTVNVLEGSDTPTTSNGGGGGTISVVASQPIDITAKDEGTEVPIEGVEVYVEQPDGTLIVSGTTNSLGVFSDTTSYTGAMVYKLRKSTLPIPRYFAIRRTGTIVSETGFSTEVLMKVDTIAAQS